MSCCYCGTQTEDCGDCQSGEDQKKTSLFRMIIGPYPDEVIMSALDNILVLWGATKIKHMMELQASGKVTKNKSCPPSPSCPPLPSCSSACSVGRSGSFHSMSSTSCPSRAIDWKGKHSSAPSSPKAVCFRGPSSRLSAAASSPRQRSPRVDFTHPADDIRKRHSAGSFSMKQRLMQAEMVCSAACEALKTRLKPKESPRSGCKGQKWLWTRLIRTKNGCQVYEVYKDSKADCSPSKIGSKAPAIVFLVLRNGHIMPFETITSV
ncbi:uncharacterized protein [Drosophila kikkawai]|uniref:Uncharacterized protein n=1 Tax=Drosophila kikkawai TaxID=30033 RepID=A0A6P4IRZ7_DROKI|nr:uncharacterized protein LOC108077430 [Drosophila kikkawai]KAH8308333.1 hypothetical protein KR059_010654 [Drosophila kikkawai]